MLLWKHVVCRGGMYSRGPAMDELDKHVVCWTLTQETCVCFLLPTLNNGSFHLSPQSSPVVSVLELEHNPT